MPQLNINEVKAHLSSTLARVMAGETVVVCKRNKPIAEIRPIPQGPSRRKRKAGYGARQYPGFKLPTDFNAPLPDEFLRHFTGE